MIYSFLYSLVMLIVLPFIKIKSQIKGFDFSLKERFVLYKDKGDSYIWFHCASVGELNTLKPLYEYYKDKYKILITVFSPRGKKYAIENFKEAKIKELPLDLGFLVKRFLNIYKPKALIIVEEELWYNLIKTTSKQIPVISINARISPSSFKFYKKFSFFFRKVFNYFSLILARTKEDKDIISYFVNEEKIKVCGDLKFVSSLNSKDINLTFPTDKKIIVAGSTYKIEEEMLLDILRKLDNTILVLAPRHLERLQELENLVREKGFNYQFLSKSKDIKEKVLIVDKMGYLSSLYNYADATFVGGTIENIGGHNILEALLKNKPVIIGKNYQKIKPIYEQFKEYITIVNSKEELLNAIKENLSKKTDINIQEKIDKIFKCYIQNLEKYIK